jgi:hypothetical protein
MRMTSLITIRPEKFPSLFNLLFSFNSYEKNGIPRIYPSLFGGEDVENLSKFSGYVEKKLRERFYTELES